MESETNTRPMPVSALVERLRDNATRIDYWDPDAYRAAADEIELLHAALGAITSTIDHMRAIGSWDAATMERVSDNIRQITSAARQETKS